MLLNPEVSGSVDVEIGDGHGWRAYLSAGALPNQLAALHIPPIPLPPVREKHGLPLLKGHFAKTDKIADHFLNSSLRPAFHVPKRGSSQRFLRRTADPERHAMV
jgi:hypothetical protein